MTDSPAKPEQAPLHPLGDETHLGAVAAEVVSWLRREGLLGPDRLVVEIGCGVGRVLRALSPHVEAVVGLDVSGAMCAEARDRTRGLDNVIVLQTPGRDLHMIDDAAADLVLAVDSFPSLVGAGLAETHVREAARALAPGGELVLFNWSDSADFASQTKAFTTAAQSAGLESRYVGQQTLSTWDGLVFSARRP